LILKKLVGKGLRMFLLPLHLAENDYFDFTWSPDERSLAFEVDSEDSVGDFTSIFVLAVAGKELRSISRGPRPHDQVPRWSPNGRQIAFVNCPGDNASDLGCNLMLMRADGAQRTAVLRHAGDFTLEPVWSPDGRWLAFTGKFGPESSGKYDQVKHRVGIYVVRPDGSGFRRLAATGPTDAYSYVAWSPDSKRLAFSNPQAFDHHPR
jgi:Tol biopolymer transport system component